MTSARVLVACVGNVLRGDDGFGNAVAAALVGALPPGADLIETGIGGLGIVHELMDGYGALIIVDAVERAAEPGAVLVLTPHVPQIQTPTLEQWSEQLSDLHLAEPTRILRIAKAAGVLPDHVCVVGCQPLTCETYDEALSAPVAAAVPIAIRRVQELVVELHGLIRKPADHAEVAAARRLP